MSENYREVYWFWLDKTNGKTQRKKKNKMKIENKSGEEGESRGVEKSGKYVCGGENQVGKKKKRKRKKIGIILEGVKLMAEKM